MTKIDEVEIGRIILVRFRERNGDLVGVCAELQNTIVLDRNAFIWEVPRVGEDWLCVVTGDSFSGEFFQGEILVAPLRKASVLVECRYADRHDSKILGVPMPKVVSRVLIDGRETDLREWYPEHRSEILSEWPETVQQRVLARLTRIEKEIQEALEKRNRQKRWEELELLKRWAKLDGGIQIKITEKEMTSHLLTLQSPPGYVLSRREVFCDDTKIGTYAPGSSPPCSQFPITLEALNIKLSNGADVALHNIDLIVIDRWEFGDPKNRRVFSSSKPCAFGGKTELSWGDLAKLEIGDTVATEYPFQWHRDWLTNGVVWLPRECPIGQEWRRYPFPAIDKGYWSMFLELLNGKFVRDFIPFHAQIKSLRRAKSARRLL